MVAVNARSRQKIAALIYQPYPWLMIPWPLRGLDIDGVVELIGGSDGIALELARKTLSGQRFYYGQQGPAGHAWRRTGGLSQGTSGRIGL